MDAERRAPLRRQSGVIAFDTITRHRLAAPQAARSFVFVADRISSALGPQMRKAQRF